MRELDSASSWGPCLEFGEGSLKAHDGTTEFELGLERQENGRLTLDCRERVAAKLRGFLGTKRGRSKRRVYCAVSARGISLRRVQLPMATADETPGLLLLQIEREFPLAPEELAWGYHKLSADVSPVDGSKPVQEFVVAAVKREVLEEYVDMLQECDAAALFTVGAFARSQLVPGRSGNHAMLDIGRNHSELAIVERGTPVAIRVLRWGGENITSAIQEHLGISREEAENLKVQGRAGLEPEPAIHPTLRAAVQAELGKLAELIRSHWSGRKLYLTGGCARLGGIASSLGEALKVDVGRVEHGKGEGMSAAIAGLNKLREGGREHRGLYLFETVRSAASVTGDARWKWAVVGGLVLLGLLSVRYTEAGLGKGRLERRVAEVKAYRESLPKMEGELAFLQYLKTNQPAYLETLFQLANAAPSGTRIETLSMNRRGDLAVRAALGDPQHVAEFRSKLIRSGLFESVSLEEQTVGPNQQGVHARFVGRWKTSGNSK